MFVLSLSLLDLPSLHFLFSLTLPIILTLSAFSFLSNSPYYTYPLCIFFDYVTRLLHSSIRLIDCTV